MAQTSFPWENIDTSETQFSQMFRHVNDGVNGSPTSSELEVVAAFSGLAVDVQPGEAMVRGHYYISTATVELALATADANNPRIDTVVLQVDPAANEILVVVKTGTPASTPTPPTLVEIEPYGVYEFPLADVLVGANAGVPGTITDRRQFLGERVGSWTTDNRPETNGRAVFGYNIDLNAIEFYNGSDWQLGFPVFFEETDEKTANYTLVIGDLNKVVAMNVIGLGTLTVPNSSSVDFPLGTVLNVYNLSADDCEVLGAAGVTIRNAGALGQYGEVSLRKRAANEWVLVGAF